MFSRVSIFVFIFFCDVWLATAVAGEVKVAVASNFLSTLNEIILNFEKDTNHTVVVSAGSSGKLYAQIKHGAPFELFFSADVNRPRLLEEEGLAVQGSRFTYSVGRLTLWSPDPDMVREDGRAVLEEGAFKHLAIANPKTAPYGMAAEQTLRTLGLWEVLQDRLVLGENIGQTFQFVFSRNAQLGFVSLSQVLDPKIHARGSRWDVPSTFHDSLEQDAVLLKTGQHHVAANAFLEYVTRDTSRAIIERFGYGVP